MIPDLCRFSVSCSCCPGHLFEASSEHAKSARPGETPSEMCRVRRGSESFRRFRHKWSTGRHLQISPSAASTSFGLRYFLAGVIGYGIGLLATFVPTTQLQQATSCAWPILAACSNSVVVVFKVAVRDAAWPASPPLSGSRHACSWLSEHPVARVQRRAFACYMLAAIPESPLCDDRNVLAPATEIPTCFIALRKAWIDPLPDESFGNTRARKPLSGRAEGPLGG